MLLCFSGNVFSSTFVFSTFCALTEVSASDLTLFNNVSTNPSLRFLSLSKIFGESAPVYISNMKDNEIILKHLQVQPNEVRGSRLPFCHFETRDEYGSASIW